MNKTAMKLNRSKVLDAITAYLSSLESFLEAPLRIYLWM